MEDDDLLLSRLRDAIGGWRTGGGGTSGEETTCVPTLRILLIFLSLATEGRPDAISGEDTTGMGDGILAASSLAVVGRGDATLDTRGDAAILATRGSGATVKALLLAVVDAPPVL